MPFLAADRLPQQQIFEDQFPLAAGKGSSANAAGDLTINVGFRPGLGFDDVGLLPLRYFAGGDVRPDATTGNCAR